MGTGKFIALAFAFPRWSSTDNRLPEAANADDTYYSGSPLASYIGEALQKKSHVIDILGATEASLLPFELTDHDDWPYVHIGPSTGCELRPVSDDQYEMVLVRDRLFDLFQAVFVTFPKIFEWRTRDLYTKHPSKPGLWLYKGRADDIIVFR